jgi:hypothetical protein
VLELLQQNLQMMDSQDQLLSVQKHTSQGDGVADDSTARTPLHLQ